MYFGEEFGPLK